MLAAPAAAASANERGVADEEVVADDLQPIAGGAGEARERVGVVLAERVLDRDDRVGVDPAQQQLDQAVAVELAGVEAERVAAAAAELGGGDVERDRDLLAGHVAGALDRLDQRRERLLVAREVGPPAAFVGDAEERCRASAITMPAWR